MSNLYRPKPAFDPYNKKGHIELEQSVTMFWLCNHNGESYYLKWYGSGWVIQYQESFFCKDGLFRHKSDIPSFSYSHLGDGEGWNHVFTDRDELIKLFREKL